MYEALLGFFNELAGDEGLAAANCAREVQLLQEENARMLEENQRLQRENQDLLHRNSELQEEMAIMEHVQQDGDAADAGDRRPNHDLAPLPGILRGRREAAVVRRGGGRLNSLRSASARRRLSRPQADESQQEGRARSHISWDDDCNVEDDIQSYRTEEDRSDLWYEGYSIECNRCKKSMPWRNGADFSTIVVAPGRSRFAQWQVVCKNCIAGDKLGEYGAMHILKLAVMHGNTSIIEGNMLRVLGQLSSISPNEDVLMRVTRAAANASAFKLPGRADISEPDAREAILKRAHKVLEKEFKQDDRRTTDAARTTRAMRRPAASTTRSKGSRPTLRRPARHAATRPATKRAARRGRGLLKRSPNSKRAARVKRRPSSAARG